MGASIALFRSGGRSRRAAHGRTDQDPPDPRRHPAAAERIKGSVIRTPMMKSETLSAIVDAEVWLKFENLQFTAAYKERGALNKLLQLTDDERAAGVVAASAGNHAQAVAYHGRRLGIPVTIVMPVSTPMIKVTQTEGHGAMSCCTASGSTTPMPTPRELEAEAGLCLRPPVRRSAVMAGAGRSVSKCSRMRPTSTRWSSRSAAAA